MDFKKVINALDVVIRMGERIAEAVDGKEYRSSFDYIKDSAETLKKEQHPLQDELMQLYLDTKEVFGFGHYAEVIKLKPYAEKMLSLKTEADKLRPFVYQRIGIDDQYYIEKALLFNEHDGEKFIRYIIASFFSEQ
jgi:hypothetical protein